jgi:hypothetical protein
LGFFADAATLWSNPSQPLVPSTLRKKLLYFEEDFDHFLLHFDHFENGKSTSFDQISTDESA